MTVPTDTPSTDGAPEPEERPRFNEESLRADIVRVWGEYGAHIDVFDCMAKLAGFRVVPEYRPTPQLPSTFCATCERYVECADDGGWTHVMSRSYGPDDFDHRVSGVTKLCGFCDAMYDLLNDEDATHHACGYCVDDDEPAGVPALDDDTRREQLIEALDEFGDKVTQTDAVIHLGRVQPEPFKSQMLDVAHALDEAQRLIRRVAAYLGGTER